MKFVCYTKWEQLPESANALFEQAERDNVFFSRPWFESLTAATLDNKHTLLLACVLLGDKVMAILPLMESERIWYSLKHGYTPLYSLLLADHEQERVLSCLAQALGQLPIKGMLLEPVSDDDAKLSSLQRKLETAGFTCDYIFRDYNWVYRLQGQTFDEYMAERPAQLRNTISRKQRKLEREHAYEIRLFAGDDVLRSMSDYNMVYNASWKQNEIDNADFMNCFVERFSKAGWSRLGILYVTEQPVAAQLWFVCHGKASIFRLAYDKAWRQYSTGSILTRYLMEYVIHTDRVEEIDFLTGNDAYKQGWMSNRRKRYVLTCVKKIKVASRYEWFIGSMKNMLKK